MLTDHSDPLASALALTSALNHVEQVIVGDTRHGALERVPSGAEEIDLHVGLLHSA